MWYLFTYAAYDTHCTGTLFYLTTHATVAVRLFHMTVDGTVFTTVPVDHDLGPRVLALGIVVNVRFLLTIFREGAGNVFSQHTEMHYIYLTFHCMSKIYNLDKAMGRD